MGLAKDVDDYIANAPDEIRPILIKLRRIFLKASPKLKEEIKWGVPCYLYKGPVGGFAAYKRHVSWGLWKASLLNDRHGLIGNGILKGGKITKISEIPQAKTMASLIKQAMALNDAGIKPTTPDPTLPVDFAAVMRENQHATQHFAEFTAARKWQYVNWITKAKRPETRAKRIRMAIDRITEGKPMK